jgi:hypothetical protein
LVIASAEVVTVIKVDLWPNRRVHLCLFQQALCHRVSLVPPDFELGPAQLHDLRQHTVRHPLTKFLACHTLDHLADFACKYLHREWLGDNLHA